MPEKSYGWAKQDGVEVPYVVDRTGVRRLLTAIPTPRDHPMLARPGYQQAGHPVIPLSEIGPFSRRRPDVLIKDQRETGSCLPHAFATACETAHLISTGVYVPLSPFFLYTLINGGRDAGSNAGDAVQALSKYGICPDAYVPHGAIRPRGYSAAAVTAAKRFLLEDAVQIGTWEEVCSALYHNWVVCFDVCAASGATQIDVDSRGVATFVPGLTNHEIVACEEVVRPPGSADLLLGGRNSWGTSWGVGGRCSWTRRHIEAAQNIWAVRFVAPDPQDPNLPPRVL